MTLVQKFRDIADTIFLFTNVMHNIKNQFSDKQGHTGSSKDQIIFLMI